MSKLAMATVLAISILFQITAAQDTGPPAAENLSVIEQDQDIVKAKADKKSAVKKILIGLALTGVGVLFAPNEETLFKVDGTVVESETGNLAVFALGLLSGTIMEIWGILQWRAASKE